MIPGGERRARWLPRGACLAVLVAATPAPAQDGQQVHVDVQGSNNVTIQIDNHRIEAVKPDPAWTRDLIEQFARRVARQHPDDLEVAIQTQFRKLSESSAEQRRALELDLERALRAELAATEQTLGRKLEQMDASNASARDAITAQLVALRAQEQGLDESLSALTALYSQDQAEARDAYRKVLRDLDELLAESVGYDTVRARAYGLLGLTFEVGVLRQREDVDHASSPAFGAAASYAWLTRCIRLDGSLKFLQSGDLKGGYRAPDASVLLEDEDFTRRELGFELAAMFRLVPTERLDLFVGPVAGVGHGWYSSKLFDRDGAEYTLGGKAAAVLRVAPRHGLSFEGGWFWQYGPEAIRTYRGIGAAYDETKDWSDALRLGFGYVYFIAD